MSKPNVSYHNCQLIFAEVREAYFWLVLPISALGYFLCIIIVIVDDDCLRLLREMTFTKSVRFGRPVNRSTSMVQVAINVYCNGTQKKD